MAFQPLPLTRENSRVDKQEKMLFTGTAIDNTYKINVIVIMLYNNSNNSC